MRYSFTSAIAVAVLLVASAHGQQTAPGKLKDQLTGDAKAAASSNPQCKLFTQAEIAGYVGVTVGRGENAGGGTGCSWNDKDYEVSAMVSVVPPRYFPQPTLMKGFKRLPGVGNKGWVAPDSGWSAGALVQDVAIVVNLSGKKASEASVVAFLQEAIKRRGK